MERIWTIVAILCMVAAGVLLLRGRYDGAFVGGALGLVAWFLGLRSRITAANAPEANASNLRDESFGEQKGFGDQDEE
jgi:hypothetical protein